jgi:hypothetical protein
MAAGVPPPPLNSPSGSYYWLEWYTNLTNFLNGTNIPWANLNFTGSNIHDIQTRHHNSLSSIQGGNAAGDAGGSGNAFHLLGALFIGLVNSTGTAIQLPASWTVSGTNPYTVTHNLGLAANSYVVMAASNGGAATVNQITLNPNTFVVTLSAAQNWSFMLTQGS